MRSAQQLPPQTGVRVGGVDDPAEAAAEAFADAFVSSSGSDHDSAGQREASGRPSVSGREGLAGAGGDPLPVLLRRAAESQLHWDLGGVRIHHDERAAGSASAVGARAFTVGNDIVLGRGEFAPNTPAGRRTLAHELAHVVQQAVVGGPAVLRRIPMEGLPPGTDLANERMRLLDAERGVDLPEGGWADLKRLGFGWVIDHARGVREGVVQVLRDQAAARLSAGLQGPASALIDRAEFTLAACTDLWLFNVSLSLGVVESAVETVLGAITVIAELAKVIGHIVLAMIYDVQNELAKAGLAEVPDDELLRPLGEDMAAAETLLATLPAALLAMLEGWGTRFMAAPHEEKAVMAGDLVGSVLFEIATWEVSAAKAGRLRLPPGLAAAEPELAMAVAGGGSMPTGGVALAQAGVGVNVGGPLGAGGAMVLQAAGKSSDADKQDDPSDEVTDPGRSLAHQVLPKTRDEVIDQTRSLMQATTANQQVSYPADLTNALAQLSSKGVDVTRAEKMTGIVAKSFTMPDIWARVMGELADEVHALTDGDIVAEARRLIQLGVADTIEPSTAAYVAAIRKRAAKEDRNVIEIVQRGQDKVQLTRTVKGVSNPPVTMKADQGILGDDDFMTSVIRDGDTILDYSFLNQAHGVITHALQDRVADIALVAEGFPGGVKDYRTLLGAMHDRWNKLNPNRLPGEISGGTAFWVSTFDQFSGPIMPEVLWSKVLLRVLGPTPVNP